MGSNRQTADGGWRMRDERSGKPISGVTPGFPTDMANLLRCPQSGHAVHIEGNRLTTDDGAQSYGIADNGIPLFAAELCSEDAMVQQVHYDTIANAYFANISYPHTEEYIAYLDRALLATIKTSQLGTVAEICCGGGEGFTLFDGRIDRGIGIDVSLSMLDGALRRPRRNRVSFVQGDATNMPLSSDSFDVVLMLGGIHHVSDRRKLFAEINRILKPGGYFYFREPVSDFAPWRWIRSIIYRLSPILDHATERPLLYRETVPVLIENGLNCQNWQTYGFFGFCLFMNSDVLFFNRLFRFIPGIRALTRFSTWVDDKILGLPGMQRAGLQVIGVAQKPHQDDRPK